MSLDKDGSAFVGTCDFCEDSIDTFEDDFMSAVGVLKKEGWRIFKEGGEWSHKCSKCAFEESEEDFDVV